MLPLTAAMHAPVPLHIAVYPPRPEEGLMLKLAATLDSQTFAHDIVTLR